MGKKLTDLTERTATADTDLIHVNSGGTDYKESKANFLADVPSRDELTNISLCHASHTYTNVTISNLGYVKLGSIPTDFGVSASNFYVGFLIRGWSGGNGGALSVVLGTNGTDAYLLGVPNSTVNQINIRLWYVPTAST